MYDKEKSSIRCKEYYKKNREKRKEQLQIYNNKMVSCNLCGKELKQNNLYYHKKKKCPNQRGE